MKKEITTFEEARDYVFDTPKFTTKNEPGATRLFLERLGNPDQKLKIVHVAGTNGKGSVCAYLRGILETAGYHVACFTSPHLVDVRERFVIDGRMISKEEFLKAFLTVYQLLEETEQGFVYHPTFFEFMFFIAMLIFAEKQPDYCILETGLGGRLDATNTVAHKEVAVITGISRDHMMYLGDTIEKIAGEKAGIMQEGVPCVCLSKEPALSVFEDRAKKLSCPLFSVSNSDYSFLKIKNKSIDFSYTSSYYGNVEFHLNTVARYQMENCSLAIRTIEALKLCGKITQEQLQEGVRSTFWAGRMEEVLPNVFVDGAHNEDGIRAFLETVSGDGYEGRKNLLFSVVSDKEYEKMVAEIAESALFEHIYLVHLKGYRATTLETLTDTFVKNGLGDIICYENVPKALEQLLAEKKDSERLYIAGSLYLVGEVKEYLQGEKI